MPDQAEKLRLLRKLLDKSEAVTVENSDDPEFKSWKNLVERTFVKVFGKDSTEFEHFSELLFYYPTMVYIAGFDYSADHLRAFRHDFKLLKDSINQYIEDIEEEAPNDSDQSLATNSEPSASKVFISQGDGGQILTIAKPLWLV
ncbi:hypothetical protein [Alkalimonas mucilaginosa]|uniref:Uncharacterized protein n=1 Tax=Alkalimonas mucilaginosa TaxID=3057676 RepID=A0ABU7JCD3_9GAMM|nr:hypothetical protein [Alkalimonas sp. MEB004]MEE2023043.1 hypothetical protein [Alkalimonas sp. MEB004]